MNREELNRYITELYDKFDLSELERYVLNKSTQAAARACEVAGFEKHCANVDEYRHIITHCLADMQSILSEVGQLESISPAVKEAMPNFLRHYRDLLEYQLEATDPPEEVMFQGKTFVFRASQS